MHFGWPHLSEASPHHIMMVYISYPPIKISSSTSTDVHDLIYEVIWSSEFDDLMIKSSKSHMKVYIACFEISPKCCFPVESAIACCSCNSSYLEGKVWISRFIYNVPTFAYAPQSAFSQWFPTVAVKPCKSAGPPSDDPGATQRTPYKDKGFQGFSMGSGAVPSVHQRHRWPAGSGNVTFPKGFEAFVETV